MPSVILVFLHLKGHVSSFGGLGVVCWPSTQVRVFKPGWIRWIFKGKKILSTPSFGGEVKLSVPCRRFAAYKRRHVGKITGQPFSPIVPPFTARISCIVAELEAPGGERWEHLNVGGSNGKLPLRNLPRMQHTRAIPVTWLGSGSYPN